MTNRSSSTKFIPMFVSLFGLALLPTAGLTFAASNNVQMAGLSPAAVQHGFLVGHKNRDETIQLTIGLQGNNANQLDAFVADLYQPSSPNYKHFLTPEQFAARFGASQTTISTVESFLSSKGLRVISVSPIHNFMTVCGTVGQVEDAFGVTINNYKNQNGDTYYANAGVPQIPAQVSGLINNVIGLDNEPHFSHTQFSPNTIISHTGSGTAGGYTPNELRSAYDINPLIQAGYDGTGQTVAVMELDGYVVSNITTFDNQYNLGSPLPTNVYVDGYSGAAGSGEPEVELDIENINATAPKAQVMVYEGPNTDQGLIDTYQKIATDNRAKVINVSWGQCELDASSATLNSLHNIFNQMAAQGQSVFAASGDSGAYDSPYQPSVRAVDSPADDPLVTGVGGTTLTLVNGKWIEKAWSSGSSGSGSGGGISTIYPMPSYQTGPGVQNSYSNGMREVPDVSADADPMTGYSIYSQGSWGDYGGTSAATAFWVGVAALNNQYAAAHGKAYLGQANPTFYRLASTTQPYPPFHDITSGNNLYYPATSGYDMTTGLGSPDAYNLIRDINGN